MLALETAEASKIRLNCVLSCFASDFILASLILLISVPFKIHQRIGPLFIREDGKDDLLVGIVSASAHGDDRKFNCK